MAKSKKEEMDLVNTALGADKADKYERNTDGDIVRPEANAIITPKRYILVSFEGKKLSREKRNYSPDGNDLVLKKGTKWEDITKAQRVKFEFSDKDFN